ncbi:nuclear transport factor 2 family protein [Arcticibacter sp. MXS-1]|uniref:nuclear transport factor 2 family protein n=1 Tax=Arcticibacter sp. MXS-1 TaxID=3341726 RepID=UPI0035A8838B
MKMIKTITAALLIAVSASAFANDGISSAKYKMNIAVDNYIDAISRGNNKELSNLLDADAKYTLNHGNEVKNYSKSDLLKALKSSEGVVQNCATDHSVLEVGNSQAIVKVSMKYDDFTKVNYVTFTNTLKGWKITNISASYN